jgi:hypothetical protein
VTLVVGFVGTGIFLKLVSYPTQPWYYLPLLAIAGSCVDGCWAVLGRSGAGANARTTVAVLVILATSPSAWRIAGTRRTNVDVAASAVARDARRGDLVVVSPWYLGISFSRYYAGAASWVTVPPIGSLAFHRYDLLKAQMANPRAMEPVLEKLRETLAAGGRVFWIGPLPDLREGARIPRERPSAPEGLRGGEQEARQEEWGRLAARHIASFAPRVETILIDTGQPVHAYERLDVHVFRGEPPSAE